MRPLIPLLLGVLCATTVRAKEPSAAPPGSPSPSACFSNADCVLTNAEGCCGGCCPTQSAMTRTLFDARQQSCAATRCRAPSCADVACAAVVLEPNPVAECRDGRCVVGSGSARPQAECSADRECTVVYPGAGPNDACHSSACGCCPGTQPVAQPVSRAEVERRPTPQRRQVPPSSPPPQGFGLSEGKSGAPRPNCSPCPAPQSARAACSAGRCVLAPMVRPVPMPMPPT